LRATVRIVPQDEIAKGTGEPPALKLPDRTSLFADRAARLRALAAKAAGDGAYLDLMASLADAQQAALAAADAPTWRAALDTIVRQLAPRLPEPSAALLRGLTGASDSYLENLAGRVGEFDYPSVDARLVPFVGAALQVEWVHRAAALDLRMLGQPGTTPSACVVCGSPPVASTLRVDVPVPGSRYLHCALCSTNWHLPRGQCTQCDTRGKLAYFHIEGGSEAIKAEACEECRSYLKVMNQEKDALADPVADDLATLALDVLMDESGYQRAGPNLFFVPGQT
jgi:FdhE protein